MNNNMSWLSLGNYINPKARNTELSNDYNQLTNRPIITLTGTSQNPIKLWKLDVGLYILNGYVQHTDALLSEARGLFVSATVGIVDGKYVMSAFIPFWEGQYEYILPSLSSETYTEHQMIRMITQGNSLTLDNIREYTPSEEYHPSTKKYVDDTIEIMKNELGKMGLNNNDIQSLMKENRRRDIAIQALLSQNSDKMVTINEEVHNISMDYSLDKGIAIINTLEGDTLVNVSKDTEYDKILSYEQDIVENTNTVDLEVDGNLNPIIVGDTLVNVCTQNNPTAITNEYTVEGNNHFALQDEVEGNCRPIIQGNTIVNRSKIKDITPLTTYVSEVEGNEMSLVDDTDTHVRVDKLVGDTMVNLAKDVTFANTAGSYKSTLPEKVKDKEQNAFYITSNTESSLVVYYDTVYNLKPETTYTIMCEVQTNINNHHNEGYTIAISYKGVKAEDSTTIFAFGSSNAISKFNKDFSDFVKLTAVITTPSESVGVVNGVTVGNHSSLSAFVGAHLNVKNLVVLEGDYTNKPIPQKYFEGLKNSYEDGYIPENLMSPREITCIGGTLTVNNNIYRATRSQDSSTCYLRYIITDIISSFKSNTIYTIVIPNFASDGGVTHSSCVRLYDRRNKAWISEFVLAYNGKATLIKTSADFNPSQLELLFYVPSGHTYIECSNEVMILEGDYTSNPPTYEEVMEHSGQYRCEVEVQGKNLFDFNILANKDYTSVVTEDNMECITFKNVAALESIFDNYNFKQNTSYTLSYDCKYIDLGNGNSGYRGTVLGFLYTDGSLIEEPLAASYDNWMNRKVTSDPNKTVQSIIRTYGTSNLYIDTFIKNIQLEEGDTATEYEPYYNQTQTVYLNSPLLKGDEVVYKESKLCHYHKMGSVVLDGSNDEGWAMTSNDAYNYTSKSTMAFQTSRIPRKYGNESIILRSDKFICEGKPTTASELLINDKEILRPFSSTSTSLGVCISKSKLSTQDLNGFRQWLSENPTTVVYELANPYYETISTSELLLPITTNCKLLTSSNIPLTTMSTRVFTEEVNILANTQYSLNFNSDVASTVNITLGGTVLSNQAIVKGYNRLSITTPSTLVNSLLIIEGSGVNISEVVVTEYDEGVYEYIEGLKSSFEDGWIPSDNILNSYLVSKHSNNTYAYNISVKPYTDYTLFFPYLITDNCTNVYAVYKNGSSALVSYTTKSSISPIKFNSKECTSLNILGRLRRNDGTLPIKDDPESLDDNWNKGLVLFEGDWTHLHLTEEDFNHLEQYKVEYKVVGKNKFDENNFSFLANESIINFNGIKCYKYIDGSKHHTYIDKFKPNTQYTFTLKAYRDKGNENQGIGYYLKYSDGTEVQYILINNNDGSFSCSFTSSVGKTVIGFRNTWNHSANVYLDLENSQIEEGTVATEYEPYKESIQTVYLNSPLLKGDTIEEIDGEVYHVHRCSKVILDGSQYVGSVVETADGLGFRCYASLSDTLYGVAIPGQWGSLEPEHDSEILKLNRNAFNENTTHHDTLYAQYGAIYINFSKDTLPTASSQIIKQWLQANPTTVVYELATPTYELIPSSSIVCKSYPNGHLDFDTNVHINNTVNFVKANLPITYANTSTNYKLQFVSDKDMENVTINALGNIIENVTINKGLNKISFTSPSDATNILTFEGLGYAYISNVQLVATDKDIDYFKGLYSTYECGLIEDESNENYGKYEVNIVSYNAPIQFGKGGKIE